MERETGRVIFLPIGRTQPRKWSGVISESVGQPNWRWKDSDGSIRRDGFGAVARDKPDRFQDLDDTCPVMCSREFAGRSIY